MKKKVNKLYLSSGRRFRNFEVNEKLLNSKSFKNANSSWSTTADKLKTNEASVGAKLRRWRNVFYRVEFQESFNLPEKPPETYLLCPKKSIDCQNQHTKCIRFVGVSPAPAMNVKLDENYVM